ncbi:MAG: excalibur calcium-binding domain-containing protein [Methylobacter sp.]|nr:excalibur calcium-binding domain-containing protein [Methylobacter sp.]
MFKGKLKRWNDDRGFGFIIPENGNGEIFIHISALKNMSRRPVVGDVIWYQLHSGNDGKSKAVNAKIDGVALTQTTSRYCYKVKLNRLAQKILIVVLLAIGFSVYERFTATNNSQGSRHSIAGIFNEVTTRTAEKKKTNYKCDGRTHCSEMTSCEEAEFFISHCPGTKMDGDNDGEPCESQWCGF